VLIQAYLQRVSESSEEWGSKLMASPSVVFIPQKIFFSNLLTILKDEKPDLMVVEDVFSIEKFPNAGITLGKVTGVILLAGSRMEVPVIEVSVRESKQVLTGNGNASKMQLEKTVRNLLKLTTPIRPYHASDAMGLALLGLFRYNDHSGQRTPNKRDKTKCNDRLS